MKTYTIHEHWDFGAVIRPDSDPSEEYALWKDYASTRPKEWTGDEFTLADFENYIESLKPSLP